MGTRRPKGKLLRAGIHCPGSRRINGQPSRRNGERNRAVDGANALDVDVAAVAGAGGVATSPPPGGPPRRARSYLRREVSRQKK